MNDLRLRIYNQINSLRRSFWLKLGKVREKNGEHVGDIARVK